MLVQNITDFGSSRTWSGKTLGPYESLKCQKAQGVGFLCERHHEVKQIFYLIKQLYEVKCTYLSFHQLHAHFLYLLFCLMKYI